MMSNQKLHKETFWLQVTSTTFTEFNLSPYILFRSCECLQAGVSKLIKNKFIETEIILCPPSLFGADFLILVFIMYLFHCQHSKKDEEETDEKHRVSVKV